MLEELLDLMLGKDMEDVKEAIPALLSVLYGISAQLEPQDKARLASAVYKLHEDIKEELQ